MLALRPFANTFSAYDPFREMERLERAFFGSDFFSAPAPVFKTDIQDKGDHFLLESDLPGVKREDISIDVEGDRLSVRAERKSEEKDYLRCERSYGTYSRSFDISAIKAEEITASYENGVLTLKLPKKESEAPASRRIEIQ
ncbi:MAG: Hsp20/alpha crystallin family protein [Oscillospiraceae bacterium]|jgi:HSP20 family protein|nr:Hsp20/alpha crystallin family protein [Oscillospiraceae bacterium]